MLFIGGGEQDWTADPLLAKQVLSQLSYAPKEFLRSKNSLGPEATLKLLFKPKDLRILLP